MIDEIADIALSYYKWHSNDESKTRFSDNPILNSI